MSVIELVMSLAARLIHMLLELTSADFAVASIVGICNGQHHCLGWEEVHTHVHLGNPNNKQGREFSGDGVTWAVALVAEQGLHNLKLRKTPCEAVLTQKVSRSSHCCE